MTPAALVCFSTALALSRSVISPLAMTGIPTAFTIALVVLCSASPLKRSARVRPCTVSIDTPHRSAIFAISTPFRWVRSTPVRIFSVTGTVLTLTTSLRMSSTRLGSASRAEPADFLHTFLAGQPMLISMISAPKSTLSLAASASLSGSFPTSWIDRMPADWSCCKRCEVLFD